MIHVAALQAPLESAEITIHPAYTAPIAALKQDEAPTKVPPKYADYADVFLFNLAMKLPENISINEHTIELEKDRQLHYRPIYTLEPANLKTLKTYIKTHPKTGFIGPFKFLAFALILFNKKPDGSF